MMRFAMCAVALVVCTARLSSAGTCYVDDPTNHTGLTSPIQEGAGEELSSLCGHEVHGTSCVLQVTDNNSVDTSNSGVDCLTLGAGVTVQMGGHTITCTGSNCGTAIKVTASSGSSGKVDIYGTTGNAALVSGCFLNGAVGAGTNAHIEDMIFDLAAQNGGSCSFPSLGTLPTGYSGLTGSSENFKDATRIVVRNAQIGSSRGAASLDDSVIHDCGTATVNLSYASGLLLTDNDYSLVDPSADCTRCTFRNAGVCHYYTNLYGIGCTNLVAPAFHQLTIVDDRIFIP